MSNYKTFEDLQALGSEKIHERTHISRDKLALVLDKAYDKIGRVQFMGFLSILEREYDVNLDPIRDEYDAYRQEHAEALAPKASVILQAPSNAKRKWLIAGTVAIALLVGGGSFLQSFLSNEPREEVMKLTSLAVEAVKEAAETNTSVETNATTETNRSITAAEHNTTKPLSPASAGTTTILPKYKVWVGMIDKATGAKTQKITGDPIVIDTSKETLLVLGHGMIEIETAGEKQQLKEKNTVHFCVENGALKQIRQSEFMERNGGKNW
ncbi:hypothetical protein E0765_11950 [Sulfuricurvum sp. IAE1]|uniref:hypothetical protein n=1 Tax=Sulfuricurvum sp. IAE1 TaxID=2546102 RepID=UPI00104F4A32|nr:hypothetical protein [Sulfuricurvum sp. IAE1]TDA62517.1 hypothetical protein E0765_11950 [Sulfuricurvum sp. IAE1]